MSHSSQLHDKRKNAGNNGIQICITNVTLTWQRFLCEEETDSFPLAYMPILNGQLSLVKQIWSIDCLVSRICKLEELRAIHIYPLLCFLSCCSLNFLCKTIIGQENNHGVPGMSTQYSNTKISSSIIFLIRFNLFVESQY